MSISANQLIEVRPGVVSAAGAAVTLSGMMLTADTAIPVGKVRQFATAAAVSAFFGPTSVESILAGIYFAGFDNSDALPGNLLFSQYPTAPVSAYLRSASLAAMTLAQLKAIPAGTLTVTVDGVSKTSTSINLNAATSFSNAATLIAAAFTSGPGVTFDAQRAAFKLTSTTTGAASTITFGSGAIADALKLTQATGAETSQGAAPATPAAAMDAAVAQSPNWAGFTTIFEPLLADKIAFATWAHQQGNRYVYAAWDTDVTAAQANNTSALGPQLKALSLSGTVALTADPAKAADLGVTMTDVVRPLAAFTLGYMASVDFTALNGRTTFAYRGQGGLQTGVSDGSVAKILIANGYNFYGDYATSSQRYTFMQPGQVSGDFDFLDSYINQIWMNSYFQQTMVQFAANMKSIPYNNEGYAGIETALATPIADALSFGAIREGVSVSGQQAIAVNASAGVKIDAVLSSRGWYLKVRDPGASVRAVRGSPDMAFYYCDGGSIQTMQLSSMLIQ